MENGGTHFSHWLPPIVVLLGLMGRRRAQHRATHYQRSLFTAADCTDSSRLQAPTLVERVKDALEPDVSVATCVNDGSIFLALGLW